MPENNVVSEIRRDYIMTLLSSGKRLDGRGPEEFRDLKVEKGIIGMAEGSAKVSLGRTSVCVGVKVEVGKPYPDSPDKGILSTNAELLPLASPTFDLGPPNPRAVELSRVVDRGIRESGCIDFKGLVIDEGEKVWAIYIDVHVLDYDGNLIDASGLGAIAALTNTVVKASNFGLGKDFDLPISDIPIPVTMVKIGDSMLADPGMDEEGIANARLTVTTDGRGHVRAMQKGLKGSLTIEDVKKAVGLSMKIGKDMRSKVR